MDKKWWCFCRNGQHNSECYDCGENCVKKDLEIQTKEDIKITENLFNFKRWFNGMKKFSSVKANPPTQQ